MTAADLRQLALDYVAGIVYTDRDIPRDLTLTVFLPLAFCKKQDVRRMALAYGNIRTHRTTGQAVNGYPIFFSLGYLGKKDAATFWRLVEEAKNTRDSFLNGKA